MIIQNIIVEELEKCKLGTNNLAREIGITPVTLKKVLAGLKVNRNVEKKVVDYLLKEGNSVFALKINNAISEASYEAQISEYKQKLKDQEVKIKELKKANKKLKSKNKKLVKSKKKK